MKRNFRLAFNELKKMGVPVKDRYWEVYEFTIDAEEGHGDWTNYWGMELGPFGINEKIHEVLKKYGLHTEWHDPATVGVCE